MYSKKICGKVVRYNFSYKVLTHDYCEYKKAEVNINGKSFNEFHDNYTRSKSPSCCPEQNELIFPHQNGKRKKNSCPLNAITLYSC